jgi:sugar lactone lactonase YvrE
MKTPLLALLSIAALTGCHTSYDLRTPVAVGPNPESVTRGFDGKLYVTLMGESRKPGDGDGKIVRVDGDKVTDFVTGLNDPKGIVYVGGYLITADFDTVWKIDASGRKAVLAGPKDFPNAPTFLNDVVVTPDQQAVLVTDMGAVTKMRGPDGKLWPVDSPEAKAIPVVARVVRVTLDGKVTEVIPPTPRMLLPNGVDVLDDGRIRIAEFFSGDVLEWNHGLWKTLATGHRSGDGIVHDSRGHFYISEVMTGRVFRYNADGSGRTQLGEQLTAAADHYVDEANGQLIVPETKAGRIVFLRL